ncbi:MOSC domain-containing protein [Eikenella sp. NML96-A-049]
MGNVHFKISQGRQPCWKLNERFGVPDIAVKCSTICAD